MMRLARFVRHFLLAVQFFTRVPVTGRLAAWVGYSPAMLRASAAHMPAVGALVGAVGAGVMYLSLVALPTATPTPWVAAVLSTVCTVWLTGALHEDGLSDLADGLGGARDVPHALEIMKDSRIGAFGALALVLALLLKCGLLALLATIQPWLAVSGVWLAHVVSRFMPVLIIATLPNVGNASGSKSKPLANAIRPGTFAAAALWCLLLVIGWTWWWSLWHGWAGVLAALLATAGMRRLLRRRLQGFTGDGLGATQQVSELAFYLGLALAVGAWAGPLP